MNNQLVAIDSIENTIHIITLTDKESKKVDDADTLYDLAEDLLSEYGLDINYCQYTFTKNISIFNTMTDEKGCRYTSPIHYERGF